MKKALIGLLLGAVIITVGYIWSQKKANVTAETPRKGPDTSFGFLYRKGSLQS